MPETRPRRRRPRARRLLLRRCRRCGAGGFHRPLPPRVRGRRSSYRVQRGPRRHPSHQPHAARTSASVTPARHRTAVAHNASPLDRAEGFTARGRASGPRRPCLPVTGSAPPRRRMRCAARPCPSSAGSLFPDRTRAGTETRRRTVTRGGGHWPGQSPRSNRRSPMHAKDLLAEAYGRVPEEVRAVVDGLSPDDLNARPGDRATGPTRSPGWSGTSPASRTTTSPAPSAWNRSGIRGDGRTASRCPSRTRTPATATRPRRSPRSRWTPAPF